MLFERLLCLSFCLLDLFLLTLAYRTAITAGAVTRWRAAGGGTATAFFFRVSEVWIINNLIANTLVDTLFFIPVVLSALILAWNLVVSTWEFFTFIRWILLFFLFVFRFLAVVARNSALSLLIFDIRDKVGLLWIVHHLWLHFFTIIVDVLHLVKLLWRSWSWFHIVGRLHKIIHHVSRTSSWLSRSLLAVSHLSELFLVKTLLVVHVLTDVWLGSSHLIILGVHILLTIHLCFGIIILLLIHLGHWNPGVHTLALHVLWAAILFTWLWVSSSDKIVSLVFHLDWLVERKSFFFRAKITLDKLNVVYSCWLRLELRIGLHAMDTYDMWSISSSLVHSYILTLAHLLHLHSSVICFITLCIRLRSNDRWSLSCLKNVVLWLLGVIWRDKCSFIPLGSIRPMVLLSALGTDTVSLDWLLSISELSVLHVAVAPSLVAVKVLVERTWSDLLILRKTKWLWFVKDSLETIDQIFMVFVTFKYVKAREDKLILLLDKFI